MKKYLRNLFIFLFIGATIYFNVSCNADKTVTPIGNLDLGILRTNESGQILGGDYSDWCLYSPVDTFTYVVSFTMTPLNQNTIAHLKWTTSKEYHNYGFYLERKKFSDFNFIKIKFIEGQDIKNDSTYYSYNDTINSVSSYTYRLKVIDIFGNYKYIYVGQIMITPILSPFFGPAYPNPSNGKFTIPFSVTKKDSVSIFFISDNDTIFITKDRNYSAGNHSTVFIYDTTVFHDMQVRLYFKNNSFQVSDSCKSYGDIQFN